MSLNRNTIEKDEESEKAQPFNRTSKEKSSLEGDPKLVQNCQILDSEDVLSEEQYGTKKQLDIQIKLTQEVLCGFESLLQQKLDVFDALLQNRLHTMENIIQEKLEIWAKKITESVDHSPLKRRDADAAVELSAERLEAIEVLSPGDFGEIEMIPDDYEKVKAFEVTER